MTSYIITATSHVHRRLPTASHITSNLTVYSTACSSQQQKSHQTSAFVGWGVLWSPVDFPHKGPIILRVSMLWHQHASICSLNSGSVWTKLWYEKPIAVYSNQNRFWNSWLHTYMQTSLCHPIFFLTCVKMFKNQRIYKTSTYKTASYFSLLTSEITYYMILVFRPVYFYPPACQMMLSWWALT